MNWVKNFDRKWLSLNLRLVMQFTLRVRKLSKLENITKNIYDFQVHGLCLHTRCIWSAENLKFFKFSTKFHGMEQTWWQCCNWSVWYKYHMVSRQKRELELWFNLIRNKVDFRGISECRKNHGFANFIKIIHFMM